MRFPAATAINSCVSDSLEQRIAHASIGLSRSLCQLHSDVDPCPTPSLVCTRKIFIFMICRWLPSGCDDRHDKCIQSRRAASIDADCGATVDSFVEGHSQPAKNVFNHRLAHARYFCGLLRHFDGVDHPRDTRRRERHVACRATHLAFAHDPS
jgi:hypothetical protein